MSSTPTATPTPTDPTAATPTTGVLDQLRALVDDRPFTAQRVGELTGHALEKVDAQSNEYFTIYRSASDPAREIASVEVREPTARSAGKTGMILLDVATSCVKRAELGDRFGAELDKGPSVLRPEQPRDTPAYATYRQPWGQLRLGFARDTGCLVKIVIDGNER